MHAWHREEIPPRVDDIFQDLLRQTTRRFSQVGTLYEGWLSTSTTYRFPTPAIVRCLEGMLMIDVRGTSHTIYAEQIAQVPAIYDRREAEIVGDGARYILMSCNTSNDPGRLPVIVQPDWRVIRTELSGYPTPTHVRPIGFLPGLRADYHYERWDITGEWDRLFVVEGQYLVLLVEKGEGRCHCDGTTRALRPRDVLYFNPGERFRLVGSELQIDAIFFNQDRQIGRQRRKLR